MQFHQTERSLRKQEREQSLQQPIIGRITAVKERHPETLERWNQGDASKTDVVNDYLNRQYEVDITSRYLAASPSDDGTTVTGQTLRDVPVLADAFGEVGVPEPNRDLAVVTFLDGYDQRKPVVTGIHYHLDAEPPVARRGTWRMQKGDMCFEAYEERDRTAQDQLPEYARIAVQNAQEQNAQPTVDVAIEEKRPDSDEYVVKIDGDGASDPSVVIDFEDGTIDAVDGDGSSFSMDGSGTITLDGDTIELSGSDNTMTIN